MSEAIEYSEAAEAIASDGEDAEAIASDVVAAAHTGTRERAAESRSLAHIGAAAAVIIAGLSVATAGLQYLQPSVTPAPTPAREPVREPFCAELVNPCGDNVVCADVTTHHDGRWNDVPGGLSVLTPARCRGRSAERCAQSLSGLVWWIRAPGASLYFPLDPDPNAVAQQQLLPAVQRTAVGVDICAPGSVQFVHGSAQLFSSSRHGGLRAREIFGLDAIGATIELEAWFSLEMKQDAFLAFLDERQTSAAAGISLSCGARFAGANFAARPTVGEDACFEKAKLHTTPMMKGDIALSVGRVRAVVGQRAGVRAVEARFKCTSTHSLYANWALNEPDRSGNALEDLVKNLEPCAETSHRGPGTTDSGTTDSVADDDPMDGTGKFHQGAAPVKGRGVGRAMEEVARQRQKEESEMDVDYDRGATPMDVD
jgi:hypothetical protein